MSGLFTRLGLGRPELIGWTMYDWANSAYVTTVITAVFPVYFKTVAAQPLAPASAASRFALATTAALFVVALLAPFLGAAADLRPMKKRMLGAFLALGVASCAGLFWVRQGDWQMGLALFVLGNIGLYGSFIFYDALLPHLARPDEVDRVSTAGYALGYVGGGVLLALNLLWIMHPAWFGLADAGAATRLSFLSVAVWWLLFSVPLFMRVPEPPVAGRTSPGPAGILRQLGQTLRELRKFRAAALFLAAFLIYNDGIVTVIRMATLYGAEIGIGNGALIGAVLMVQFAGIPFTFLLGAIAQRMGPRPVILGTLAVYALICLLAFRMTTTWHFFAMAFLVAMVQGGCQALSRSLFATLIPRSRSSEFFAFFAIAEKCASILGPATFALAVLLTGSSRYALPVIALFFVIGAWLLLCVDVKAGRAMARAQDA